MKRIAQASHTGHGTNVIAGVAVGMESTGAPVLVISVAMLVYVMTHRSAAQRSAAQRSTAQHNTEQRRAAQSRAGSCLRLCCAET